MGKMLRRIARRSPTFHFDNGRWVVALGLAIRGFAGAHGLRGPAGLLPAPVNPLARHANRWTWERMP
jgi:hypothetical protein